MDQNCAFGSALCVVCGIMDIIKIYYLVSIVIQLIQITDALGVLKSLIITWYIVQTVWKVYILCDCPKNWKKIECNGVLCLCILRTYIIINNTCIDAIGSNIINIDEYCFNSAEF